MNRFIFRLCAICTGVVALALAGCAGTTIGGIGADNPARPKAFVISDFVFSSDVVALDRGYTARLERKVGSFPIYERKQRTNARVNDEIIATIIVTLKEAGLDAEQGSEEGLTLQDDVVLVTGGLQAAEQVKPGKNSAIGFGAGRDGVLAAMTLSRFSAGSKTQLLSFATRAQTARKPAPVDRKQVAVRNAAFEAALAAEGTPPVKLSPDTEGQARRLGAAIGEKIVAFAKERGWLVKSNEVGPQGPVEKTEPHADRPAT